MIDVTFVHLLSSNSNIKNLIYMIFFYKQGNNGVADGARTHDNWNHNPGLYQLSYSHHRNWPARQDSNL